MFFREEFTLETSGHGDMHDITKRVAAVVTRSGIKNGIVHIFNIGSTGAIGTIEFEDGLKFDLREVMDRLIPPSRDYAHEQTWHDGNGHSHLQATLLGPGITVPVGNSRLMLGTWQQVFHLEADVKPRTRRIVVTVMGE